MNKCNFSIKHYEEILENIIKSNYLPIFFDEVGSDKKEILIRHDIDLDVESALQLAKIENSHNIKATYFFWMTSPFYNIFNPEFKAQILQIRKLGHTIGLHFYEEAYEIKNETDLIDKVNLEVDIFNKHFGDDINIISFHMPSKKLINNNLSLGNISNTYHSKYFANYKYMSDSARNWREGCACRYIKDNTFEKLQLLTHPIWWIYGELMNDNAAEEFIKDKILYLKKQWDKHIQV